MHTIGNRCRRLGNLLITLTMLALVALTTGAQAELLINPGFEDAIGSEWTVTTVSGTFTSARDAAALNTGSYGARLTISGISTGHAYFEQVVSGLAPGSTYNVSGWMRHVWDRTDKYHVYIEVQGGGAAQVSGYSTTTYAQYNLTQTADGSGQIRLRLHLSKFETTTADKICDAHFDDLSVVPVGGTVPNPPTGGTAVVNSSSQITWGWTRASGVSGEVYRAYDAATAGAVKWTSASEAASYAESGLDANTLYGSGAAVGNQRHLATLQGYESETRLALPAEYTLAAAPTYDDSLPYGDVTVRCDCGEMKTDCTAGQNITFTYNNSFGTGAANVGKFTYAWSTSSTWDGSGGTDWSSGATLVKQAGADPSTYYLHLRSWNSDSPMAVNPATLTLGPYSVGGGTPTLPAKVVKHHVGGAFDGTTWATAFDNVQDALDLCVSGDEVWVASGTYVENITVPSGVAVYGGFAGTETIRSQRNWSTNVSVLDGNGAGSVITIPQSAASTTRIDGFTITNGRGMCGGAAFCGHNSAPVIINNIISGNQADFEGGGIHCSFGSSPVIAGNRISGNAAVTAGGGICGKTGSPTITNNLIACNSSRTGGGICAGDTTTASAEPIRNNTIVANAALYGGGINCRAMSSATVSNNVVAFNSSGIRVESGTGTPVLKKNCVYGNDIYNYTGISQGSTDIVSNPQLASFTYGNSHIQAASPCRNSGDNTQVISGYLDIDGQTRIQNTTVDIGADESDGTTWSVTPAIVRVATTGSDSNNGSTWALAKRTIQAAINAAASGGEVWVKAGTYNECIELRDYVYVYGGFNGTESARSERNWAADVTIIDGQAVGSAVCAALMGYRASTIDGFTLRNGKSWNGAGVFCSNASPLITNNTITANSALGNGAGVYLANSVALVEGNQLVNNLSMSYGGGINCHYTIAKIARNNIENNSAFTNGCGAFCSTGDTSTLVNNRIVNNHQNDVMGSAWGVGVSVDSYANPALICNTIADNKAGRWVIYAGVLGNLRMYSNIVSFNNTGIYADTNATISQTASFTGDPLFVNRTAGNYQLSSGSACINAADVVTAPGDDYLGYTRDDPDIGCYEFGAGPVEFPVAPTSASASPSTICGGSSATLVAEGGSGTTLRWLTGSCDGTSVGTGNGLVVYPTATTTYYVRWETSLGNSTCVSTTVTVSGTAPIATVGPPQTIDPFGTTAPLGGNTPIPPEVGAWSIFSGGTGVFSSTSDPNATFTHTGGDGPMVLRWTVSRAPCADATADVMVTVGEHCLNNPGFDESFTDGVAEGWTKAIPESGTWAQETSIVHAGTASQKIIDSSGGSVYTSWLYQTVSVQPNRVYVPTMWLYRLDSAVIHLGIDPNGGTSFVAGDAIPTSNQWVRRVNDAFTSGSTGQVTVGLAVGYQTNSGTAYFDDVAIEPQAPQSTGGTATISAGGSATLTASGGFGGLDSEMCWYTGSAGTGTKVGSGMALVVFPASTTTYYPRWETGGNCGISADGAAITVTVSTPQAAPNVTSITPSSGPNTGTISITNLAGTGFATGATVKLTRNGETDIAATSVVVVSATQITCSFDLTGAEIGLWDVVVTNPDTQSGTLSDGFGVTVSNSAPVVGTTISWLLDTAAETASASRQFRVWGRAQAIDSSTFWLDDGSGTTIKVFAPGYTEIATGSYVSAVGTVDVSSDPMMLVSAADRVTKHN